MVFSTCQKMAKNCLLFSCLILFTLWSTTNGNTYDIPRWLRVSEDELVCPEPTGQFNHPKYCDFFLNCWQGHAVVGRCHFGLVFNEVNRACDYRSKVDCGNRPISDAGEAPAASIDPQCPHSFGTFADPGDCSQFVVCQGGLGSVKKCPQGREYYNSAIGSCDSQRPSGCPEIGQSPPTAIESTTIPPTAIQSTPSTVPILGSSSKPPEVPDYEIGEPAPEISAGGTPTLAPTTKRPQAPFRPKPPLEPGVMPPFEETPSPPPAETESKPPQNQEAPFSPKPPFVTEKPPAQIVEPPQESEPTNPPQVDFSPKPPFVPAKPPKPEPEPPKPQPKPPLTPEQEQEESNSPSEAPPTGKPSTVTNLKPKPPLQPKPDEDPAKPPLINLENLKPKPSFKPPASGENPIDAPQARPPPLRPENFKPQRPPGAEQPALSTSTHAPIDGEDDPHILFPFLPKFPDLFKCPVETMMLPVYGDCSSMIACIAGVGHRLFCPPQQTFDLELSRCTSNDSFCPKHASIFISGMKTDSPDIIYAYLPVSKLSQIVKVN